MADYRFVADAWVNSVLKEDGEKANDPTYCAVRSRIHLLHIMYFTGDLISVAKGIRYFLGVIILLLLLTLFGVIATPR